MTDVAAGIEREAGLAVAHEASGSSAAPPETGAGGEHANGAARGTGAAGDMGGAGGDELRGADGADGAVLRDRHAAGAARDRERAVHGDAADPAAVLNGPTAAQALLPLARLGLWVLEELREHAADIDGGDVQDQAEAFGVVQEEPADPARCGECCACAEAGSEICYRDTDATTVARRIIASVMSADERVR